MNETTRKARALTARELGLCGTTDHATVCGIVLRDQTAGTLGLCGTPQRELRTLIRDALQTVTEAATELRAANPRDLGVADLDEAKRKLIRAQAIASRSAS